MHTDQPDDLTLLRQYFTPDELAVLSPEELRMLALVQHEEVPEVPAAESRLAEAGYRRHVIKKLRERALSPPPSPSAPK